MKGYTEERGRVFKLDYDAATKQFVSKPVDHDFLPKPNVNPVVEKLAVLVKRRGVKKVQEHVARQLAAMGPELRDDVGMADVYSSMQIS